MSEDLVPPYRIEALEFSDDGTIVVTFVRPENITDSVVVREQVIVPLDKVEMEAVELIESACALVDAAFLLKRNPPGRLLRRG